MATKNNKSNLSAWGKFWRILVCICVPLAVGGASAALCMDAMKSFGELKQPPLSPPAMAFPIAWTILYALMGIASYLIFLAGQKGKVADKKYAKTTLIIYGIQLVMNFCWSPVFFNFKWYWPAFAWIMIMWVLTIVLLARSKKQSMGAFWCILPLLLWTTFAAYLNISIAILN